MRTHRHSAFSLVELSIVVVILGLLVGGILSGQSLIRAAELRSVVTEYNKFYTATQSFRDKYFAIPGDMTNATSFWGTDPGGCPPAPNSVGKTATCNGNGDGVLLDGSAEIMRFWQHLADAGLIEGSYSGVSADVSPYGTVAGVGVPRSRMSGGQWSVRDFVVGAGDGFRFAANYKLNMQIGATTAANYWNDQSLFKPEEAWNIDTKVDDGKPGTGKVLSNWAWGCTTAANGTDATATYALTTTSPTCMLQFISP